MGQWDNGPGTASRGLKPPKLAGASKISLKQRFQNQSQTAAANLRYPNIFARKQGVIASRLINNEIVPIRPRVMAGNQQTIGVGFMPMDGGNN